MGHRVSTRSGLILDFGGVLTTDLFESIRGCARREGLPDNAILDLLSKDRHIRPLFVGLERGEVAQPDFERQLAAAAGLDADRLLSRMCADLRPDEPMLTAIATLRRRGARVGVLSNSWGAGYFDPYEGYDLHDRVDAVVLSDQVGMRKPEPGIFALMLDKLGVPASATVFVDDIAANLVPARDMGMAVIHHTHTPATFAEMARLFGTLLG
jgi:putative hydrolase of the HAD superfamily